MLKVENAPGLIWQCILATHTCLAAKMDYLGRVPGSATAARHYPAKRESPLQEPRCASRVSRIVWVISRADGVEAAPRRLAVEFSAPGEVCLAAWLLADE